MTLSNTLVRLLGRLFSALHARNLARAIPNLIQELETGKRMKRP
jgi:hypothetical protein